MKRNIHLLIIDPQNDFCDLPDEWLSPDTTDQSTLRDGFKIKPQLAVPGAHGDMLRLAAAMNRGSAGITDISITLDSHHFVGIERPTFWVWGDGRPVAPFTLITLAMVRRGEIRPRNLAAMQRVLAYLEALEARGKYQLMVWTVHCEIGTWGYAVHDAVRRAYNRWEEREQAVVNKVTKGSNPWTEHYSPMQAEVPDPADPTTQLNTSFIGDISRADRIFVAGEAGSHCVKAGVIDLANNFGGESLSKIVLVKDCMSAVSGFDQQYADFLQEMQGRGLQVCTADEMAAELIENARR